jgi:hypothetical protein
LITDLGVLGRQSGLQCLLFLGKTRFPDQPTDAERRNCDESDDKNISIGTKPAFPGIVYN